MGSMGSNLLCRNVHTGTGTRPLYVVTSCLTARFPVPSVGSLSGGRISVRRGSLSVGGGVSVRKGWSLSRGEVSVKGVSVKGDKNHR